MATTPERQTQAQRRSASEEALLDSAAELIARDGVDRASLRRIGERAGASRGLPAHHFGSKDTLLERLAQRSQERMGEHFTAAFESGRDQRTALEGLRFAVQTYLDLYETPTAEVRALVAMWGAMVPAQASVDGIVEADRHAVTEWGRWIHDGRSDGSIRDGVDPEATGLLILALTRGIAAMHLIDPAVVDLPAIRSACDDWIVAALGSD